MENETKALAVRQELTPQAWGMLTSVGAAFHKSGRMSILTQQEGAVKALFCFENGLPLTAARGLFFVNGKLGIESGVIAAMLRQHPDYDYNIVRLDPDGCTIAVLRYGAVIGEASFTMDDAATAGLAQKDTFRKYPEDMLFAKAITRAQRRYAPDVFGAAVYSSEEMGDWTIEGEVVEQKAVKRPSPPEFDQLIEKFGLDACVEAGVLAATNEAEVWRAVDKLTTLDDVAQRVLAATTESEILAAANKLTPDIRAGAEADRLSVKAADAESQELDAERAQEVAPTLTDIVQDVEAGQSPFKDEAK